MSGLDPLAAFALQAVANAQAAIEESTLNLGSLLSEFQAKLSVGDILSATVLPPQNGVDRVSLLGRPVDAQLPPGINPGETIALQVTGFTNTAILVRNLGAVEPNAPLPQAEPPPQLPGQPQTAILRSPPTPSQPNLTPQSQPNPPSQNIAPPRELFVAASVRPTQPRTGDVPSAPPSRLPIAPVAGEQSPPELEARIIATRASTTINTPPAKSAPLPAPAAPAPVTESAAARAAISRASVERSVVVREAPQTPETALLSRLRVPISATTLAAARIVDTATRSVTSAYEKLDAALAKLVPDERTSTLRSTLAFVARLDLRNVRALPEQIASYVSNVITGPESKIAQVVRLWSEALEQEQLPPDPSSPASPAPLAQPARETPAAAHAPASALLAPEPQIAARAAERTVALEHDVKSSLLQLVANPPQGSSPQVLAALRDALTATTAAQLNALTPQNNTANSVTIPLPAYFYEGGAPAQLQISRDAPGSKNAMDADNFHIAFILDTKSLGTVAIDVQTVGRSISIDVKTETPRSADRFRTSLAELRTRLESLHYRVANMAAGLAPRGSVQATPAQAPQAESRNSNVDMRA